MQISDKIGENKLSTLYGNFIKYSKKVHIVTLNYLIIFSFQIRLRYIPMIRKMHENIQQKLLIHPIVLQEAANHVGVKAIKLL